MESITQAKSYRDFVEWRLRGGRDGGRRRGVGVLADALKCHPTFIAKVLAERADFSMEQALAFADFFALTPFESQFFVELVQWARASDERAKRFFAQRVEAMRAQGLELSHRLGGRVEPSPAVQSEYYSSWIPQYVHIACQIEGQHTLKSLAAQAHLPEAVVDDALRSLARGGILREDKGQWRSIVDFMHLPRQSHLVGNMHQQWRLKVAGDIARQKAPAAIHFSGLMSVDRATAEAIRELLTDSIAAVKPLVEAAASREIYFFGVDFYPPG